MLTQHPDFIVVGAGSAGCVVARVLAERGFRVLLVEAGQASPVCRTPAFYPRLFGSNEDWDFETVPQPNLANRRIRWPRGRGPGGSTRINAMIWYPPLASDLAQLASAGDSVWSVDSLTASLEQITDWVRPEPARWTSNPSLRFLTAAEALNFDAHVFARMTRNGVRFTAVDLMSESAALASIGRVTAEVRRVLCKNGHASGVEVIHHGCSELDTLQANVGTILCTGAVATPTILMQSGIGPRDVLDDLGLEAIHVVDEVGRNLADHLIMPVVFETRASDRFPSSPSCHDLARFQVLGSGPLASNLAEAGGVGKGFRFQVSGFREEPLVQIHVTPTHYLLHPDDKAPAAMTIGVNLCNPLSRGRIRLRSENGSQSFRVEIDPEYFGDSSDLDGLLNGIDFVRNIARQSPLSSFVGDELVPGAKRDNRESLMRSIARYAQTLYHPTSSCRMGRDSGSVIDERLALRGINGLYLIDASVLPTIPSVNPNATVMMVALHAANLLADIAF